MVRNLAKGDGSYGNLERYLLTVSAFMSVVCNLHNHQRLLRHLQLSLPFSFYPRRFQGVGRGCTTRFSLNFVQLVAIASSLRMNSGRDVLSLDSTMEPP